MADLLFSHPRLASIYDSFDGQRADLLHYLRLIQELGAKSVLDIGCGTGCLAILLAEKGFKVVGLDPADASLDIARAKPYADKVNWIHGDVTVLPKLKTDLAIMTGNVAQVFTHDEDWIQTLRSVHDSLEKGGFLVFEVRDPAQKAWEEWTPENTYQKREVANEGLVEAWCEVQNIADQLVSFRWTYRFQADGKTMISDSTLRFREKEQIERSLIDNGFAITQIRGAPDRPGKEFVFITKKL